MAVGPAPISQEGKETPYSFYALLTLFCDWEGQVTLVPHEEPHHVTQNFYNLLEYFGKFMESFLFLWRSRKFANLRSTNPREARDYYFFFQPKCTVFFTGRPRKLRLDRKASMDIKKTINTILRYPQIYAEYVQDAIWVTIVTNIYFLRWFIYKSGTWGGYTPACSCLYRVILSLEVPNYCL